MMGRDKRLSIVIESRGDVLLRLLNYLTGRTLQPFDLDCLGGILGLDNRHIDCDGLEWLGLIDWDGSD